MLCYGLKDGGRTPPVPDGGIPIGGLAAPGGRIAGGRGCIAAPGGGIKGGMPGWRLYRGNGPMGGGVILSVSQ